MCSTLRGVMSPFFPLGVCGLELLYPLWSDVGSSLPPLLQWHSNADRSIWIWATTGSTLGDPQRQVGLHSALNLWWLLSVWLVLSVVVDATCCTCSNHCWIRRLANWAGDCRPRFHARGAPTEIVHVWIRRFTVSSQVKTTLSKQKTEKNFTAVIAS